MGQTREIIVARIKELRQQEREASTCPWRLEERFALQAEINRLMKEQDQDQDVLVTVWPTKEWVWRNK